MVMMVGVAVETSRSVEVIGAPGQPQLHERFQSSVDRRARDTRDALFDVFVKLVHGRMILTVEKCVEHDAALHGDGKLSLAGDRLEELEFPLLLSLRLLQMAFILKRQPGSLRVRGYRTTKRKAPAIPTPRDPIAASGLRPGEIADPGQNARAFRAAAGPGRAAARAFRR